MLKLFPDLWQTPLELRFGSLKTHAYILENSEGRDMIYVSESTTTLEAIRSSMAVGNIYLSHSHEITKGLSSTKAILGAGLVGHQKIQKYFPKDLGLDRAIQTNREILSGGLEAIYTPGHTDNNVCYRYVSPHGKTYLFVGDTLYPDDGNWKALVMKDHGGDRKTLINTLQQLKKLQADIIIPSVAVGEFEIAKLNEGEWFAALDAAIASI